MAKMNIGDQKKPIEMASDSKRHSIAAPSVSSDSGAPAKTSKMSSFRKSLGIKSSEERAVSKTLKLIASGQELRNAIVEEESSRWPDHEWRLIVASYQEKVAMTRKIGDLRARHPIQYLHLLRAGYFEPIPVAWYQEIPAQITHSLLLLLMRWQASFGLIYRLCSYPPHEELSGNFVC